MDTHILPYMETDDCPAASTHSVVVGMSAVIANTFDHAYVPAIGVCIIDTETGTIIQKSRFSFAPDFYYNLMCAMNPTLDRIGHDMRAYFDETRAQFWSTRQESLAEILNPDYQQHPVVEWPRLCAFLDCIEMTYASHVFVVKDPTDLAIMSSRADRYSPRSGRRSITPHNSTTYLHDAARMDIGDAVLAPTTYLPEDTAEHYARSQCHGPHTHSTL